MRGHTRMSVHDKALQCISALFTPTLRLSPRLHTNYV